jgi:ribosomal protein L40E
MIIWIACTLMALVGLVKTFVFPPSDISFFFYLFLCLGGFVILIINETVFGIRKARLEINRDETIKTRSEKQSPSTLVLAICPECKSRIPAEAKYCPECGADLQS